jgi:hypothetical protein
VDPGAAHKQVCLPFNGAAHAVHGQLLLHVWAAEEQLQAGSGSARGTCWYLCVEYHVNAWQSPSVRQVGHQVGPAVRQGTQQLPGGIGSTSKQEAALLREESLTGWRTAVV